ncbi:MAG: hypothetical protein ACJ8CR_04800 [Roseiflexaceae bacterium]
MRTLRITGILLALLCALVVVPLVAAQPLTTVAPKIGPPGTRFLFSANEFASRERLSFWLNRPDGHIEVPYIPEEHRANESGDAVWTWEAPSDALRGAWQMVVHGLSSGAERVIDFTIGEPPSPDAGQPYGVDPRAGVPGRLFRFFANGFSAGEYVDVRLRGPNGTETTEGLMVSQPANPDGRIDGSWNSPAGAAPGEWQILARGADSGVTRTIPITLQPPAPGGTPYLDVSPNVGAPGMRFVVSATGFMADEEISIWLNQPDGRAVPTTVEGVLRAAPDGRAGWTWVAPQDIQRGAWQMVAHGRRSGVEVVGSFTIQ